MRLRTILVLTLLLTLGSAVALAQGTTSRITGVVTDKTGAVVAGVAVTAVNEGTGNSYRATSSATGVFVFDSLQVGTYTVSAESKGFKKFVSTGNVLNIGAPIAVNVTLEVGAATETVEVRGGYELIQTESSGNFGTLIDSKSLTELPIVGTRGRNPLGLVFLVPGVQDAGGSAGGESSVHGSRDRAWNYTLDGIDSNETSFGGSELSPTRVNPDSLAEFKLITGNFTPEYGRNTGGQVTMVTKSGTNNLHGTGFWFYQSPFLMANSPVTKATQFLAGKPNERPQFIQNIYGGSIGVPIIKNKTFFFANIQLLHAKNTYQQNQTVYTDTMRKGIFRYATSGRNQPFGVSGASVDASGNPVVPFATYDVAANDPQKIGLDSAITAYLAKYYPAPNTFTYGDGFNTAGFIFLVPQLEKQVDLTVKIDHTFNAKHSLYGRWAGGHQNTKADSVNGGWPAFPGLPDQEITTRQPRNLAINWRWVPSAKTTNEFVVGMNRFIFDFPNPDPNVATNPPYNFTNITGQALNSYISNGRALTTLQMVDNFTLAQGAHTWKWGINFRYARHIDRRGSIGSLDAMPQIEFGTGFATVDVATFKLPSNIQTSNDRPRLQQAINELLGRINTVQAGFVAKDLNTFFPSGTVLHNDQRWPEYDFYAQDTWKLKPNLTVDYGLRLEARLSPRLQNFPNLVPNQPFAFGLTPSSTLQWVKGDQFKSDWNNVGPTIGVAWDPFKDGKTSVRANYRLAYDRINTFSFSSGIYQGLPGLTYQLTDSSHAGTRVSQGIPVVAPPTTPQALTQPPAFSTNSITVPDPDLRTPKVHMWGASIQRQVAKNTVVTITYNGRKGVGLYGGYDANQTKLDASSGGESFLQAFNRAKPCVSGSTVTYTAACDSPLFDKIFGVDTRKPASQNGTQYVLSNFTSSFALNNVAGLAQTVSQRTTTSTSGIQLVQAAGLGSTFLQAYPQFTGALNVLSTRDWSTYHGLETQIERRFSNGLLFQGSWTWSKSLDLRSFDPTQTRISRGTLQSASATPFDIFNPRLNYAPSDFDHTHVFQSNWVYELPFGEGKRWGSGWSRALEEVVGGWEIAGNALYETGRPFTIYAGANTMSNVVGTPASCISKCDPYMGHVYWDATLNQQYFISPAQRANLTQPAPGQPSNVGRNYFRLPIRANLNATLAKRFKVTEHQNLQARLEMQNVTNSQMYDSLGSFIITSSSFGRMNQSADGVNIGTARRMQLSLKYTF